jgi:uncharacterized membrane protein
MAMAMMSWMFAIPVLGMMTGLRTMTPMAVLCWFAYLGPDGGHLPLDGTWASWAGKLASVIVFTLLAIGEYIGDKLPKTPNRTAPGPLLARVVFGGLVGAIAATGVTGSAIEGIILGALGALVGAFLGYLVRKHLVEISGRPDWNIALIEDASAIILSIFALGIITG